MILPLLLALSSLVVTPERPISPPVLQAAAGPQQNPAVASDGHGWLAAWTSNGEIAAARIDESGTVIDRAPIEIDSTGFHVAVASGTDGYLVVWSGNGPRVRARLVDRDGHLGPIATLSTTVQDTAVAVAFTAGRFLVTWADNQATSLPQMGMLLDPHGTPVGAPFKLIDGAVGISAIAAGANDFLAVGDLLDITSPLHPYPREVFAVRISPDGHVSAPIIVSDPASPVMPTSVRAVWDGSEYFAGWSTNQGGVGETRGARIAADDSVTRTAPFYAGTAHLAALIWNGSDVLATLNDATSVVTQRVSQGGEPLLVARPWFLQVTAPASAWNGQSMLVVYGTLLDVWAKLTDASGAPLDPATQTPGIAVALSPAQQYAPSVTASIAGSAVIWNEVLPVEGQNGMMTFLLGDTAPQGRGIVVGGAGSFAPDRIAFAGGSLAITARNNGSPTILLGTLDSLPFLAKSAVSSAWGDADDVVADGKGFLVSSVAYTVLGHSLAGRITVGRVATDGSQNVLTVNVSDVDYNIAPGSSSIASSLDGSLLVWVRSLQLEAAAITAGGSVSGVIPIASGIVSATVRWNGQAYVISALAADGKSVRWFLVNRNGTLLNASASQPVAVVTLYSGVRPRSAPLGETTLVAWIDGNDIRGALIRSDDGSPLGEPFLIATANAPRNLDMDGEGDTIRLVYQAESPYPGVPHLTRVYTRTVALAPAPPRRRAVK